MKNDYDFKCIVEQYDTGKTTIRFRGEEMTVILDDVETILKGRPGSLVDIPLNGRGTVYLYGNLVNRATFSGAGIRSVYIEKNDKQTDASNMFAKAGRMTEFTAEPNTFANVTKCYRMLDGCKSLDEFPLIDLSNVTDMIAVFHGCKDTLRFPKLDLSSLEDKRYLPDNLKLAISLIKPDKEAKGLPATDIYTQITNRKDLLSKVDQDRINVILEPVKKELLKVLKRYG